LWIPPGADAAPGRKVLQESAAMADAPGMRASRIRMFPIVVALLAVTGCASRIGHVPPRAPAPPPAHDVETGMASYYGAKFAGRATASGSTYDPAQLTAAHRSLPFGTRVRVTHLGNGRSVVVEVTDRGPFARGRIIDLSRRAARTLGFIGAGLARVRIEPLTSSR
jgi:rare lipoprotein A